jgi:thaumarchaeosortase
MELEHDPVAGDMMNSITELLRRHTRRKLEPADLFLLLAALPILLAFVLAPETFGLSWAGFGKLGRGGLLFVLFFLWFELLDFRKTARSRLSRNQKIVGAIVFAIAFSYFGAVAAVSQFTNAVNWVGGSLGALIEVSNSWLMAIDYLAFVLYLVGLAVVFFGARAIIGIITAVVFSAGMLIMYLLDSFFPYGALGPLQFWANFIVAGVALLAGVFGLPIYGFSNSLTILGKHGTYRLFVFWPSVGVHSMLIYSLVMILLAVKLNAPLRRKLIYATLGVTGTLFLNVTRIFVISVYAYLYAASSQSLDAFHNSIGEIIFPIWILAFIVIVLNVEQRLSARTETASVATQRASTP